MKEIFGDLWYHHKNEAMPTTIIAITTNGSLVQRQKFNNPGVFTTCGVTGAGCAQEATSRYPEFNSYLGANILARDNGIGFIEPLQLLIFPVKHEVNDNASISLIERSMKQTMSFMTINSFRFDQIVIPRPGCGYGRLDWEVTVKPKLEKMVGDDERYVFITHRENQTKVNRNTT